MTDLAPNNLAAPTGGIAPVNVPTPVPLPAAPEGGDELTTRVFTEYPQYAYLLVVPEIRDLLLEAVDPNKGFSPEVFAAKLYATNWWRSTQASVREWDARFANDPAQAQSEVRSRVAEIRDIAGQAGLALTDQQALQFAEQTLRFGISTSSSEFRDALALLIPDFRGDAQGNAGLTPGGEFGLLYAQIKQTAREYLMPISDAEAWRMAEQAFAGDLNIDGLTAMWGQQAAARNPQLAAAIESGVTPMQFFSSTRSAVARELEIGEDQIDLMDPRWSQILGVDDGKGGNRPMTMWEAQRWARSQDEWRSTKTANDEAAGLGRMLLEQFGAVDL